MYKQLIDSLNYRKIKFEVDGDNILVYTKDGHIVCFGFDMDGALFSIDSY